MRDKTIHEKRAELEKELSSAYARLEKARDLGGDEKTISVCMKCLEATRFSLRTLDQILEGVDSKAAYDDLINQCEITFRKVDQ